MVLESRDGDVRPHAHVTGTYRLGAGCFNIAHPAFQNVRGVRFAGPHSADLDAGAREGYAGCGGVGVRSVGIWGGGVEGELEFGGQCVGSEWGGQSGELVEGEGWRERGLGVCEDVGGVKGVA